MTFQRGKENYKFTFTSEEINAWKTFCDINKLTIVCSETPLLLCKNQSNDFQCKIAGFQTVHIFSRYFEKGINQCPANVPFLDKPGSWFLLAKCTKHLWKSDILNVTLAQMFFPYFAGKKQLPGFLHGWNIWSIDWKSVKNSQIFTTLCICLCIIWKR